MRIVIGLGNPDKKYARNFHNMGFMTIDKVAEKLKIKFSLKSKLKGMVAQGDIGGEKFLLVKPLTYMNLSGECVAAVLNYYKETPENALIVYDDLDISIGEMRYRNSGSAGTHNGMKNIVAETGSENFPRIRIGIKKYNDRIDTIDYVLSDIPEELLPDFISVTDRAAACAEDFLRGVNGEELMQRYNGKAK